METSPLLPRLFDPRALRVLLIVTTSSLLASGFVSAGLGSAPLTPHAISQRASTPRPPILFVHGNGDSAALWHTTLWRFESNGYPRDRLFAIDMIHPEAPVEDSVPEQNRSSTVDQASQLASEVARILLLTGSEKLVLVGSSRGGNTIRNYIKRAGGWANVSIAILCGTPNHGVSSRPTGLDSEWNGQGHFLSTLNRSSEIHPEVRFVTLRSDHNDKYAQPTGEALGFPGAVTGVDFDSPALRGAENVTLAGLDHREVAFHPDAFTEIYRVVTSSKPRTRSITPEPRPILNGMVSGFENGAPTNLPLTHAQVSVFATDPLTGARLGPAAYRSTTGADGRWGPFVGSSEQSYELVVEATGYPITHLFRSPFPRSTRYAHIRLAPLPPTSERAIGDGLVTMSRPRGYFGVGRDDFTLDGEQPSDVVAGVPQTSTTTAWVATASRTTIVGKFNDEVIAMRPYPSVVSIGKRAHLVIGELHN